MLRPQFKILRQKRGISLVAALAIFTNIADAADSVAARDVVVINTPGLVAFWDFVQREPDAPHRFVAHVAPTDTNQYALDAVNYVRDYWGTGRESIKEDFASMGHGPFGEAIRRATPRCW